VLAWHVDYWDSLGWKDRFGSKEATARQKRYAATLGLKGLQTPHLYAANRPVKGAEFADAVRKEAAKKAVFAIEGRAALEKGKVVFEGTVRSLEGVGRGEGEPMTQGRAVTVQAVLFAKKTETKCTAGENKGRTLVEYYAVVDIGKPAPLAEKVKAELKAPEGITDLGVAILVEDGSKMETLECGAFPVNPS
jgi:hypothetical protein